MKLYETLLQALPIEPIAVKKVVVGVHWTLVCSQHCGLASTIANCGPHGHSRMRDVGKLHEKTAQQLAEWVLSDNFLEASVGMAAINSMVQVDETKLVTKNASDVIAEEGKDKNVVIVGHFPFVEQIKSIPRHCWVIEKQPYGDDFPEDAAEEYIPQADIVAITGTAFINHSMEKLLSLCRKDASVMILGPSTPLITKLFDYGVTFLSGARVDDPESALTTIIQGASLPQVNGIRLVTMTK
ncbi:MAG: DUF364 domain-containing protein [Anaerolineaceae bacterium]|jgi:uncharacterized protein (DUF4213/DUF364 family)|nr:DUF364 domain-containing protein [Anaerolineaceae bacterium]